MSKHAVPIASHSMDLDLGVQAPHQRRPTSTSSKLLWIYIPHKWIINERSESEMNEAQRHHLNFLRFTLPRKVNGSDLPLVSSRTEVTSVQSPSVRHQRLPEGPLNMVVRCVQFLSWVGQVRSMRYSIGKALALGNPTGPRDRIH